jgi:hypothetical protein
MPVYKKEVFMSNNHYKFALLKSIRREWDMLLYTVERLTPEQMVTPDSGGWSPKDNLAHLTVWLKALTGYHMDHKSTEEVFGISKEMAENFDFDRVNAYTVEQSRERSAEDVLDDLKKKYAEVMARLESMSFEELLQPRFPDDPGKAPLLNWVLGNTTEHFREHRTNIEKVS